MLDFLKRPVVLGMSLLLAAQIAGFHAYPKNEVVPLRAPLKNVPTLHHGWQMMQETEIESEVADLLKADETLSRVYRAPERGMATLFIAFFKTQRTGVSPHSPKVCLPGSGWVPTESERIAVTVPGESAPITVNRFIVSKGESRSVVLYWYQTPWRVVANEYMAKFYTVVDGFRHRRSDTSMVRIIVPCSADTQTEAEKLAIRFAQDFYPQLKEHLPRQ